MINSAVILIIPSASYRTAPFMNAVNKLDLKVLVISDKSKNDIGNPLIQGASINAKIIDQIRGDKIIVFKKRRRKNYKSTRGHKQYLTVVKIESINNNGKKSSPKGTIKKMDDSKNSSKEKLLSTKKINLQILKI